MKTSVHFLDRQLGGYCLDQKSIDQPPKQYPVPGYEIVGSAKLRKLELENKTDGNFLLSPLPFPRSHTHIFACLSLTRHLYYLRAWNRLPKQTFLGLHHASLPHERLPDAWRSPKSVCAELRGRLRALSKSHNWLVGPWPDQSFWQINRLFPIDWAEKPSPLAYYVRFDWSGRIVWIKIEIPNTTGMVWPVSSDKWRASLIDWRDDQSPLCERKHVRLWIYNRQIHVIRNEWKKPSQFYKTSENLVLKNAGSCARPMQLLSKKCFCHK